MNDVLSKNAFSFQSSGKEVNDLLPPCSIESGRMPALPDGGQPGQKSRNRQNLRLGRSSLSHTQDNCNIGSQTCMDLLQ